MKYGSVEYQYAEPIAQGLIEDSAFRHWILSKSKFSNSSDARILHKEMKLHRRNPTAEWWRFYFTEGCRCLGCSGKETDKLVRKVPVVTGHLIAHPINLPSWLSDKKPPPFSHPSRVKRTAIVQ